MKSSIYAAKAPETMVRDIQEIELTIEELEEVIATKVQDHRRR